MNEAIKYYFNKKGIALSTLEVHALLRNKVILYEMSKVVNDMLKEKKQNLKTTENI